MRVRESGQHASREDRLRHVLCFLRIIEPGRDCSPFTELDSDIGAATRRVSFRLHLRILHALNILSTSGHICWCVCAPELHHREGVQDRARETAGTALGTERPWPPKGFCRSRSVPLGVADRPDSLCAM